MAQIDPTLAQQARQSPDEPFQVIVRVQGDMDARQQELEAAGLNVTRRLRLIQGFSGSAKGECINNMMNQDWIVSIERDQPVQTMQETE
jgi:hypothetical protein